MRLRVSLGAACIVLCMQPALVWAQVGGQPDAVAPAAEKIALAQRIVDLGYPRERREAMFFAAMDQMVGQMREATTNSLPASDEGAMAIVDDWTRRYIADSKQVMRRHIPFLMDGMVQSYAAMFTTVELQDILAFVSTPSGQRFFELSPAVLAEPNFARANQGYMNEVMGEMPAAQADLIRRLKDYFAKQQPNKVGT